MKPITYKDNVSELVSISVKEAMQMLMDNNCKPVEVLDSEGEIDRLDGIDLGDADEPFIVSGGVWCPQIYRRENYIIGYNGEKLPPLPEGYGLMPNDRPKVGDCFYGKVAVTWCKPHWADCAMYDHCDLTLTYSCPIDSYKWRTIFPEKLHLELGKWYECRDQSITSPTTIYLDDGHAALYHCSDGQTRLPNGFFAHGYISSKDIIRAIDPELSVSLSNLDHETANKVWKAKK